MYWGQSLFLVLSGPSLSSEPLHLLREAGHLSMGVNNSWLVWRPNFWVGVDPPSRFSDAGWQDPAILKMCPQSARNAPLRVEREGLIVKDEMRVSHCPNVGLFVREDDFNPSTFWASNRVQWGTLKGQTDMVGIKASRSVMLVAIKLAYWLGFKRVYLLGADFKMSEDPSTSPYAWDENKDANGRKANNRLYQMLDKRFRVLVRAGMPLEIYNCTAGSGLTAFPHVPLERALEREGSKVRTGGVTKGWYA